MVGLHVTGSQLDWLAVRSVAVGIRPGFFAVKQRFAFGKIFLGDEALQSGEPTRALRVTSVNVPPPPFRYSVFGPTFVTYKSTRPSLS